MKRFLIGLLLLLVAGAGPALASNPEPFNVLITIRQAITVTKMKDLDFGTVEAGPTTYVVTPAAGAQAGAGTGAAAAEFQLTGESGQTANANLDTTTVTITCTTPVSCGTSTLSVGLTLSSPSHLFSAAQPDLFWVGGSVDVTGASAGQYTGSANLTLVYQ